MKAIKNDKAMSKKRVVSFCEEEIRGDTAEMATKKRSPGFSGKIRGVTTSVAAPDVTHPSDATVDFDTISIFSRKQLTTHFRAAQMSMYHTYSIFCRIGQRTCVF